QASIHVARWIQLMREFGWDLHLFPLDTDPINRNLSGVTVHMPVETGSWYEQEYTASPPPNLRLKMFYPTLAELGGVATLSASSALRLGESDETSPHLFGPNILASVIRSVKPDLIHSMEFQHAAYRVLRTRELYGEGFPKWLATNWGSDIYYFGRM